MRRPRYEAKRARKIMPPFEVRSSSVKSISGFGGIIFIGHLLGEKCLLGYITIYTPGLVPFQLILSGN